MPVEEPSTASKGMLIADFGLIEVNVKEASATKNYRNLRILRWFATLGSLAITWGQRIGSEK
jgi:hypothetical protein